MPLPPEQPSGPKRRRLTGKQPDLVGAFRGSAAGSPAAGATIIASTTLFLHEESHAGETATGEASFELPPELNGEIFESYLHQLGPDEVGGHQVSQVDDDEDVFGHGEDMGAAAYQDG